jgi:hypothetical protein
MASARRVAPSPGESVVANAALAKLYAKIHANRMESEAIRLDLKVTITLKNAAKITENAYAEALSQFHFRFLV